MLAPNTLLQNRYLVEQSIGQGGMGTVYLATDQRLGNRVAIKESILTEERLRQAFEREARLLAHSRHPALPKVTDHFSEGAGQFLVMEYIAGDDLATMIEHRQSPFPIDQVMDWADELLDALDYLHRRDPPTIHRDIKPANLKLTADNQIILLDFGLAKGSTGQTVVGSNKSILGYTPKYAPLEQVEGTGTDARSDLYALAATLHHLLTAVPPPDPVTRVVSVARGKDDPLRSASEINPLVPQGVSDVLMRAMASDPAGRPHSAAEMRRLLQAAIDNATNESSARLSSNGSGGAGLTHPIISDVPSSSSAPHNLNTSPTTNSPTVPQPVPQPHFVSSYPPPQPPPHYQSHHTYSAPVAPKPGLSGWIIGGSTAAVLLLLGVVIAGLILAGFYIASNQEPDIPTFIVAQRGGGQFTSINQAIQNAPPNARILVRPGTYNEGIVLNKPISIIGDGPLEQIIVQNARGNCIVMQTTRATVRGLTLRGRAGTTNSSFFTVDIQSGELVLENSDVTSDSLACVAIHGQTANPTIRNTRMHNASEAAGLFVFDGGRGTIEDCDIYENGLANVEIRDGGNPIIRRTRIRNGSAPGVFINSNGSGTFEDCEIANNAYAGVELTGGGNPVFRRCRINRNGYQGVWARVNGVGAVENSNLTNNRRGAFLIENNSRVRRANNTE